MEFLRYLYYLFGLESHCKVYLIEELLGLKGKEKTIASALVALQFVGGKKAFYCCF